jgi:hypothetical protein
MGRQLTKSEARKLLTPVVDGEVSAEEREAFLAFITNDEELRQEYESMKQLKAFIENRCPSAKAPDSLRQFLATFNSSESVDIQSPFIDSIPKKKIRHKEDESPNVHNSLKKSDWWFYAAAAIILISISAWGFINYLGSTADRTSYNIEEYAYQHFMKNDGRLVPPTISTASLGSAEIQLAQKYDFSMTIPALKKADFKGVVYQEFVPQFKAPMLEYYIPAEDQFIYIFAFDINQMEEFGQLVRDQEAVKACTKAKDFHIRNVNGKHVVSWKWDDIWYAAISNHDGNILASLVQPLEFDPSNE